jgi:predicted aspartyl protease
MIRTLVWIACAFAAGYLYGDEIYFRQMPLAVQPLCHVTVDKTEFLFLLDTGSSLTMLDISVFQALLPTDFASRSERPVIVPAPTIKVGTELAPLRHVGLIDCSSVSDSLHMPIVGVLGCDFLSSVVVVLDSTRSQLSLLDKIDDVGDYVSVPMTFDPTDRPLVNAMVGGVAHSFLVDTGHNGSLTLQQKVFDQLLRGKSIALVDDDDDVPVVTSKGLHQTSLATAMGVTLADLPLRELCVRRATTADKLSNIGMRVLCRFDVKLDFPGKRMFIRKSPLYGFEEIYDRGMDFDLKHGAVEVLSVRIDGQAARAGLHAGDRITSVDGKQCSEYDFPTLLSIMTCPRDSQIDLSVVRGKQTMRLSLGR